MLYLRAAVLVIVMVTTLVFVAPIQALAQRREWSFRHWVQKRFCRLVCAVIGSQLVTIGTLPSRRPVFLVSNHLSWTDILAFASLHPFAFLAKKEVESWPILGFLAKLQGTIFVDRQARKDIAGVNVALANALHGGQDVLVFAEGTSTDGSTLPRFNSAHFGALRDTGAVIAPAAVFYTLDDAVVDVGWYGAMTFLPHLRDLLKLRRLRCHVVFGEQIETFGKDRKTLAAETQNAVRALLLGAV